MLTSILLFVVAFLFLFVGIPVAFAFGGAALLVALLSPEASLSILSLLPSRIYGIMSNATLMAMPLFIFMGLVLEKSGMAEKLLRNIGRLFGSIRGGMAIGVVAVGVLLAASTGVVGASVVMMGVIAVPAMLKSGYSPALSSGVVAASGTLGQIIPPSIVLILLGDVMQVSVGDLFAAAIVPSLILVLFYVLFILALAFLKPALAPALKGEEGESLRGVILETLQTSLPPIGLIIIVLGGIFLGVVTPTEAAALGAMGSILLTLFLRSFSLELLRYAAIQTVVFSGMIFAILIGASAFTLVFNDAGGGDLIFDFFSDHLGSPWAFIWVAMGVVFLLGFFIDFIEICFVVVPLFVPLVGHFGIDPIWFAMLLAINLQTSFLTPPFGFALFYLKGAVGDRLKTSAIYQGAVPFILLQLLLLGIVVAFPAVIVY